jgi:hypothetical protein
MRTLIVLTPLVLGLALSACAGTPREGNNYMTDLERLSNDCTARGGILAPTGNQSGRPQLDNVCEIRGQTARAPSNPG